MSTFKYVSGDNLHTSVLYHFWKHAINTDPNWTAHPGMWTFCVTYLKPPLLHVPGARACLLFFQVVYLPSFMLPAHELSRQPLSELSLKEFLLLVGSRPVCLHSAAGEAPYCLDKLPNTQLGGCPITHPLRCVCAITALYILCLT